MGAQRKGGATARVSSEDQDSVAHVPLQAILLADSFTQKFRPITLERPKVLFPLANVHMIDYTLAWLESSAVEEVFVFCCAHSKQVIHYLENSHWFSQPNFQVTPIESHNSVSAGDALRLIYDRSVIHGDFILISGDTVSNTSLTKAIQEHKDRKKKDNFSVMTMIIKQSKPSPITHQSRLGTDELIMAIDPDTKQLLYYEDKTDRTKGTLSLDKMLLIDNPSISLHNDNQDCYIDICSPEVLSLFTDNFDYQHLRRHFVKGLLVDDIMGYKIFTHEIKSSYAARIDNFRSYDTVSKDIIQRWTYPLVPDVLLFGNCALKLDRQGMYRGSDIRQSRSAQIGSCTVIGSNTSIGNNTKILNSVIGEGCTIGSDVSIEGSYVWNNVTIENGCRLRQAMICDGVILKSGAVLNPGVVLSFNVVIGQQFTVPAYSKVSLLQQPIKQDSDEELEYDDQNSGTVLTSTTTTIGELNGDLTSISSIQCRDAYEVGTGGVGYIWSVCDGSLEEEWKHSVAPIPADKLTEATQITDDLELSAQDANVLPISGELNPDYDSNHSEDEDAREYAYFEKEVQETFLRAVNENVKHDHIILEVNALRLAYKLSADDCPGALFYSIMMLALDTPHSSTSELYKNVDKLITSWRELLKSYLVNNKDAQIEVILKFEEMCLEYAKEFTALFAEILHLMYDNDILQEEAILDWVDEKEGADDADKVFVKKCDNFIQWLREASEEED